MANSDIKLAAAGAGVRLWQIADEIGMLDSNFSRKLRHELPDEEKARYMAIIQQIAASNGGGTIAQAKAKS